MSSTIIIILGIILISTKSFAQTYPNNEDGQYEDMLTPAYYLAPNGDGFRNEINKFIHFARLESFQHPLEDSAGLMPLYTINRGFGDEIGREVPVQHHPAIDLYLGNRNTFVNMFAAYDGLIHTFRDAEKYRDYLSLTKDIKDSLDNTIGKMVAIYGHLDLDMDKAENLFLDGQYVSQGDTVSKHLYSGTMGGPHLHFEIRYYRPTEVGNEGYYGWSGGSPTYTDPSAGIWISGYWDPNIGYGFANPENHLSNSALGITSNDFEQEIKYYPNPTKDIVTIDLHEESKELTYSIYNINGQIIEKRKLPLSPLLEIDLTNLNSGIYFINLTGKNNNRSLIRVIKE